MALFSVPGLGPAVLKQRRLNGEVSEPIRGRKMHDFALRILMP
jgi:hypothetical protein